MNMYEELQERGLIAQVTDEKKIREMDKWDDTRINEKKEIFAYSLTELVHGKEEADKAKIAAYALFNGSGDDSNMPTTQLKAEEVPENGISIIERDSILNGVKLKKGKKVFHKLVAI